MPAGHPQGEYRSERQREPSLAEIVREWGRIGCIGFGGPNLHQRFTRLLRLDHKSTRFAGESV
jgi:chromate transporter